MTYDIIDTARLYFSLSNQADLPAIKKLFHPEATYSSAHTGLYYGIADIMDMMEQFFKQYHHLQWHIDHIQANSQHITEIEFTCHTTDHDQQTNERSGTERLVVVDGLIRHIEVR